MTESENTEVKRGRGRPRGERPRQKTSWKIGTDEARLLDIAATKAKLSKTAWLEKAIRAQAKREKVE